MQASNNRVHSASAPHSLDMEMSLDKFRSWKTSMQLWITLHRWAEYESVCYIRLQCKPEVQMVLDSMYPIDVWTNMSVNSALEALEKLTVKHSNKAADKELFYNLNQGPYETISAFFTRAHKLSANANFACPQCEYVLGPYLLISKIAAGLHDTELKRETYRHFDNMKEVDQLRAFCMAHEAASKAATKEHVAAHADLAGTEGLNNDDITDDVIDDVIGAIRRKSKN